MMENSEYIKLIEKEILEVFKGKDNQADLYYKLFHSLPESHYIIKWTNRPAIIRSYNYRKYTIIDDIGIRSKVSANALINCFKDNIIYQIFNNGEREIIIISFDFLIEFFVTPSIVQDESIMTTCAISVYCKNEFNIQNLLSILPNGFEVNNKYSYKWVTIDINGNFDWDYFTLKNNFDVNISENYNSDIPFEELCKFCLKDSCGLTLLYGDPGTGKTTIIKNLIGRCCDKEFYLMDAHILSNISSSNFINFLMKRSGSIFVLEDCEKLLMSRNTANNPWIGTLLNLTDGMLGEGLGIKFICTFNADINTIDKALLREGRLDICYEFKPLNIDKSKILCNRLGKECNKPMTLAEIYKSKLDKSKLNKTNKLGF